MLPDLMTMIKISASKLSGKPASEKPLSQQGFEVVHEHKSRFYLIYVHVIVEKCVTGTCGAT